MSVAAPGDVAAIIDLSGLISARGQAEPGAYRAWPDSPDAIFAANDTMAVGCLLALRELGLRVPEDVAIAGFDDIRLARLVQPSLTTARVQIADLGSQALECLAQCIDTNVGAPLVVTLTPQLVERSSNVSKAQPEP